MKMNGAAGRILTCMIPLRRRMPDVFDHGSNLKMVGMAGFWFNKIISRIILAELGQRRQFLSVSGSGKTNKTACHYCTF